MRLSKWKESRLRRLYLSKLRKLDESAWCLNLGLKLTVELGLVGGAEIATALVYSKYKCGKMLVKKPNQGGSVVGRLGRVHS